MKKIILGALANGSHKNIATSSKDDPKRTPKGASNGTENPSKNNPGASMQDLRAPKRPKLDPRAWTGAQMDP